ncbi:hypothetical protein [Mycolicibacterium goodii]|uniref:Tat pathway signal protein n=1 Tax=Mycolicibacterium goodii TaxID=134601 RepID=A0ABS6HJG8_MYCGD|nr:hypothetical protein [Mycolicibacterium goodii]MBU8822461.1 hypothetical protein [Mycolicibacterium goodii]MBU8835266.1 hypothetical protein [Mycolicibacterium goodii]ULN50118.1 hypothetical protein MI170_12700 [Mycolicibacterium goodii]
MPSALTNIDRRRFLLSAAALSLLGVTATACGSTPPPPELADLTALLDRARADSTLATEAAGALPPQDATARALTAVANERSAHAQALSDELTRMTGEAPPSPSATSAPSSASPSPGTSATTAPVPNADDVVAALEQSADQATAVAARLSGYRAGLVGSIAAACTAAYKVALDGER